MSPENIGTLTMPHTEPDQVGTVCDCGTTGCPDFADHDRQRRASETDWMLKARQPARWNLAGEAA